MEKGLLNDVISNDHDCMALLFHGMSGRQCFTKYYEGKRG